MLNFLYIFLVFTPEDPDVLNAQALGISGLIAGILKKTRGKHTM
jgi:hypothetical protein